MKTSSVIEKRFEQQKKRAALFHWLAFMLVNKAVFLDALYISTVNTALPRVAASSSGSMCSVCYQNT
jgi:hypothetical protein